MLDERRDIANIDRTVLTAPGNTGIAENESLGRLAHHMANQGGNIQHIHQSITVHVTRHDRNSILSSS